jgi:DNA-binding NtrC family response regulator
MKTRADMLICGCRDDDVAVLRETLGRDGPRLQVVDNPMKLAQRALARCPLGVVLGVGERTRAHLDIIPLIRSVRSSLPIIVIAENDSIHLERRARQMGIFYYLVHPIEKSETEAVFADLTRSAGG